MPKIDIVFTKEQLEIANARNPNTVAVVIDIIFATTSISAMLEVGVNRVYVANDLQEAYDFNSGLSNKYEIAGENMAQAFDGHRSYEPLTLFDKNLADKNLIYVTTNGTVALRKTTNFYRTYAASLRNAQTVANKLLDHAKQDLNVLLVCSGSHGHFNLEDFYGAGCILHYMGASAAQSFELSDAAKAALLIFKNSKPYSVLSNTALGQRFIGLGKGDNLKFSSEINASNIVGVLNKNYIEVHADEF